MIKVRRWSSLILALALLTTVAFLIPGVLRASETDKDSEFAEKVAGTYLVAGAKLEISAFIAGQKP
jgi:hypothetical protein